MTTSVGHLVGKHCIQIIAEEACVTIYQKDDNMSLYLEKKEVIWKERRESWLKFIVKCSV